jgi:hypothetical protein
MEKALAEKLVEVLNNEGHEAEVHEGYSGRGMYGKTTYGVVCNSIGTLLSIVICHADSFCVDEEAWPMAYFQPEDFSTDSMGRDTIIY